MIYYYCTCDPKRRSQAELGKTPYRRVKVNKEGICIDCGYYAISCGKNLDPNTELRAYLMDEGSNYKAKNTKGGLSFQSQKHIRRVNERRREDKNGDMDVQ